MNDLQHTIGIRSRGIAVLGILGIGILLGLIAVWAMHRKQQPVSRTASQTIAPVPGQLSEIVARRDSGSGFVSVLGHPSLSSSVQFILQQVSAYSSSVELLPADKRILSLIAGSYQVKVTYIDPRTLVPVRTTVFPLNVSNGSDGAFIDLNNAHISRIPFPTRDRTDNYPRTIGNELNT